MTSRLGRLFLPPLGGEARGGGDDLESGHNSSIVAPSLTLPAEGRESD